MRKKEPSNHKVSPERRFTLPKSHILRGRRNFEELFSSSSLITAEKVNLRFSIKPGESKNVFVGFIAPKKIGKAVQRIRTKRLLKEAYRLNQHIITETPGIENRELHFVFMAKQATLTFDTVQNEVVQLLTTLRKKLLSNSSLF